MKSDILTDAERTALVELEKTTPGIIKREYLAKLYELGLADEVVGIPRLTGEGRRFLNHSRYLGQVH